MTVEIFDSGEIYVRDIQTGTDGVYIPLHQFAEMHDVPESLVRVWKHRGSIVTLTIFGAIFVKKDTHILKRRYTKHTQKCAQK